MEFDKTKFSVLLKGYWAWIGTGFPESNYYHWASMHANVLDGIQHA